MFVLGWGSRRAASSDALGFCCQFTRDNRMDRLKAIESFVFAARSNSFSGAARHLRVSRAMVTRRISELEGHLGVRLFHRTTRELSLTSAGRQYFGFCSNTLQALE